MFKKLLKIDSLYLFFLSIVSLLSHWNYAYYPAYREDEGTYIAQAWAVLESGSLAPYTYWYDHSPVGWFFIAFWNLITGNIVDVDNSIIAGRIFIVILNVCSALLVYTISKQLTQNRKFSFLASLLFILTPLAVDFQRRVFLDNIMVFWLLISVYFSIRPQKLYNVVLSAITFSIAVLSKESAIVFLPVIITSIFLNAHKNNKPFVTASWIAFAVSIISFYPLYALIKGEFFPYGSFLGGDEPHVSLLEALSFQAGRSQGLFWQAESAFRRNLENAWLTSDSIYIILGTVIAPLTNLVFYRKYKWTGFISMMVIIYVLYLMRGQVLDWYIIPLLPLGAINIALLLHNLQVSFKKYLPRFERAYTSLTAVLLIGVIGFGVTQNVNAYRYNQTDNQRRATEWVKSYVHDETTLLIDNYAFYDINQNISNITDTNIHYYYKADPNTDPEIADGIFRSEWENIDYIMVTPAVLETLAVENFDMVQIALDNSDLIIKYNEFAIEGDPIANYPVEIREVNNFEYRLKETWDFYKDNFILPSGQVLDADENTSSQAQSYALLRSVWVDDQTTFDNVLNWTENNLQKPNNLFARYMEIDEGQRVTVDEISASDADIDIAFALLQASQRWDNEGYIEKAQSIIDSIWLNSVVSINDTLYLTSSDNSVVNEGYLMNPSYYSPAMFRVFADATNNENHDWSKLANDSYIYLNNSTNNSTNLVPNWNIVTLDGQIRSASPYITDNPDNYGFDAFRTYYRVALDKLWFDSNDATVFLDTIKSSYFEPTWNDVYDFGTVIESRSKNVVNNLDDVSTHAGVIAVFNDDPSTIDTEIYLSTVKRHETNKYWGQSDNYYDHNWGWFATALYGNQLENYWNN